MYACICRNLRDRDVQTAKAAGAKNPAQVFKHHGTRPNCGSCLQYIQEQLDAPTSDETPPAA